MKRTIEKLHRERVDKEDDYSRHLSQLEQNIQKSLDSRALSRLEESLDRLEEKTSELPKDKKSGHAEILAALKKTKEAQSQSLKAWQAIASSLLGLAQTSLALMDAKDREWDALGNNHVGMIFKSMEWRVDKLAAEYGDVKLLMHSFLALEDKLERLLAALEDKKLPSPREVGEILEPLRDWRYAGFENRFRGSESDVRNQQEGYLSCFRKGGKVLDLGCGRGEFLDLLRENGFRPVGVDLNGQMAGMCLDRGLDCRQGDLLEKLAEWPDAALDGVFSSQVIEHLPPEAIRRLVKLAFEKLAPGGSLVLETVNPLSVFALVHIYFLDMSHRTPVHPLALRFLLETEGFEAVELRYSSLEQQKLQALPGADETALILNRNIDRLNELLFAAPNYAAFGKKP